MAGLSRRSARGGGVSRAETPKKGEVSRKVPRRPLPGSRFASRVLLPLLAAMFFLMALAPLFGLVAGITVNLVVHWYEIGMGI